MPCQECEHCTNSFVYACHYCGKARVTRDVRGEDWFVCRDGCEDKDIIERRERIEAMATNAKGETI